MHAIITKAHHHKYITPTLKQIYIIMYVLHISCYDVILSKISIQLNTFWNNNYILKYLKSALQSMEYYKTIKDIHVLLAMVLQIWTIFENIVRTTENICT